MASIVCHTLFEADEGSISRLPGKKLCINEIFHYIYQKVHE